ncbi:histone deacetylase family protein [Neorhodopirellula pilleata]|uniref:Acetoin utilization protein AcuC n=1 Tax=Neorhodopirellula pilleata TaxID=2714738 RepID=A0A5C6A226_9BACT|nr:histone deacetylase [Neorhodopirellula pilleata]TWT93599.1 Acetoin utilization protein AcuC [Neorhodopirellula pilleata]
MDKYRLLRQEVVRSEQHLRDTLIVPTAATDDQLKLCHDADYLQRVVTGTLSSAEIRRIGFPWSPKMVERSRRSTGATIAASRAALEDGVSANLAGGTHHAFAGAGEGYCVFNDAAVAMRTLQHDGLIRRGIVIDLDVHQGNGTASILTGDESVTTLSIHGVKNFPLRKVASDLDVALPDGTGDEAYLTALDVALQWAASRGPFDLAIYLAGADPYEKDRLGRLSLTFNGLQRRDEVVLTWCHRQNLPVAIAMAGGYAHDLEDIVRIHAATLQTASRFHSAR